MDIYSSQNGDVQSGTNWTGGNVPGPGDTAHIQHIMTHGVTSPWEPDSIVIESGGSLSIAMSHTINTGGVDLVDGGSGTITVGGTLNCTGSLDVRASCSVSIDSGGVLTTGTYTAYGEGTAGVTIEGGGTFTISSPAVGVDGWIDGSGLHNGRVAVQMNGGTFNGSSITGGAGAAADATSNGGDGGPFLDIVSSTVVTVVLTGDANGGTGGAAYDGYNYDGGVGGNGINVAGTGGINLTAGNLVGATGGAGSDGSDGNATNGGNGGIGGLGCVINNFGSNTIMLTGGVTGGNGGAGGDSATLYAGGAGAIGGYGLSIGNGCPAGYTIAGAILGGNAGPVGLDSGGGAGAGGDGGHGVYCLGASAGTKTSGAVIVGSDDGSALGGNGIRSTGGATSYVINGNVTGGGSREAIVCTGGGTVQVKGSIAGAVYATFSLPATCPAGQVWVYNGTYSPAYTFTGQTMENSGKFAVIGTATGGTVKNMTLTAQALNSLGTMAVKPFANLPAAGDVQSGVSYGQDSYLGTLTGTMVVPAEGDVRLGTGYGSAGTEFTGTMTHVTVAAPETSATLTVYDSSNNVAAGINFQIELLSTDGTAGRSFPRDLVTATSDAQGVVSVDLLRASTYRMRRERGAIGSGAWGPWTRFTTGSTGTYTIPEVLGKHA